MINLFLVLLRSVLRLNSAVSVLCAFVLSFSQWFHVFKGLFREYRVAQKY